MMIAAAFFIFLTPKAHAPIIAHPKVSCGVTEVMAEHLEPRREGGRAACQAETQLRGAGWSDAAIMGALSNAWHESHWLPSAVGDRGQSVGFWQLHARGLGHGMTADARHDMKKSTRRIISVARKLEFDVDSSDPQSSASNFCQRIMRPSAVRAQIKLRTRTARLSLRPNRD